MAPRKKRPTRSKPIDFKRYLSLVRPASSLLIVIISILVYRVVSSQTSQSTREPQHKLALQESSSIDNAIAIDERPNRKRDRSQQTGAEGPSKNRSACNYDKGQWTDCQANGSQTKFMQLKSGGHECKATKTIRRDCEAVGCKYARGQWSSVCLDGQRFRIDTLVERIGGRDGAAGNSRTGQSDCKPSRRVTKDCKRTCHYIKSAWGKCTNGFRTRILTLADDENPASKRNRDGLLAPSSSSSSSVAVAVKGNNEQHPASGPERSSSATEAQPGLPTSNGQECARRKLIRRACRQPPGARNATAPSLSAAPAMGAANDARRAHHSSQPAVGPQQPANNMTPAQRRRFKQMQLKQQQQQQQQQQKLQTGVASSVVVDTWNKSDGPQTTISSVGLPATLQPTPASKSTRPKERAGQAVASKRPDTRR